MKRPHWLTILGTVATAAATIIATGGIAAPAWLVAALGVGGGVALKLSPGKNPPPADPDVE